jgi:hypothetical protein
MGNSPLSSYPLLSPLTSWLQNQGKLTLHDISIRNNTIGKWLSLSLGAPPLIPYHSLIFSSGILKDVLLFSCLRRILGARVHKTIQSKKDINPFFHNPLFLLPWPVGNIYGEIIDPLKLTSFVGLLQMGKF